MKTPQQHFDDLINEVKRIDRVQQALIIDYSERMENETGVLKEIIQQRIRELSDSLPKLAQDANRNC